MAGISDKSTQAIIEAANEWLLRMHEREISPADEAAFDGWLRESPAHVREYLRAEAMFAALEGIDSKRQLDIGRLLSEDDGTVVALETSTSREHPGGRSIAGRRRYPLWVATAATLLLSLAAISWYAALPHVEHYSTGLGEQRRLVLDDGSVIEMNTQSELEVQLGEDARLVRLLDGEALFTIAKDPKRPFVVTSKPATVRALGTQFNVYKREMRVLVTVLEGRVMVDNTDGASRGDSSGQVVMEARSVELQAGDVADVRPASPIQKSVQVNAERTLAWTERRLIFDNEPLSAVVAEFNRYNRRQLVIYDTALGEERISAVFDADQPDALLRFLAQNADIDVVEESPSRLVILPR